MRTVRLPRKCLNRINPCNICTCSRLRARGECGGSLKIINRLGRVHNNLRAHRQSHHCGRHVNAAKSSKSLSFPPWHTHIIIPWELISGWWLLALGISVCVCCLGLYWKHQIRHIFGTGFSFHTWWPISVSVLWHSYLIASRRNTECHFTPIIILYFIHVLCGNKFRVKVRHITFCSYFVPTPHISLMCTR